MIHLLCLIAPLLLPTNGDQAVEPDEATQARISTVQEYLTSTDSRARKQALGKLKGESIENLIAAIPQAQLWPKAEPGFSTLQLVVPTGSRNKAKTLDVEILLPETYDPVKAYPLLIAYHGQDGNGQQFIRAAMALLGPLASEFIVAAPTNYGGMWLGTKPKEAEEPLILFDHLRRAYHIDTDRMYVMGYSLGGHASFLLATLYKDHITAAVPLAGTRAIQMGAGCLDILLPNIAHTPVLTVYGADDQSTDPATGHPAGIAVWNRYIQHAAQEKNLPITMIELPGVGHGGVLPPKGALSKILTTKRPPPPKTVAHRFRYPSQGRDAWLRQTRFAGKPWSSEQLIVSPGAGETVDEAMTAMLKQKLAYIAGKIEGQNIRIETQHCDRIEVLLNDDLVDLDKDITITVDGTVRFEGKAKRSIETMLDIAKSDWEFQRLYPVRFQISRKGKAIQR